MKMHVFVHPLFSTRNDFEYPSETAGRYFVPAELVKTSDIERAIRLSILFERYTTVLNSLPSDQLIVCLWDRDKAPTRKDLNDFEAECTTEFDYLLLYHRTLKLRLYEAMKRKKVIVLLGDSPGRIGASLLQIISSVNAKSTAKDYEVVMLGEYLPECVQEATISAIRSGFTNIEVDVDNSVL